MIFSEIYGNYYKAIATILDAAIDRPISKNEIRVIVEDIAFAESVVKIPDELSNTGECPLLDKDGKAITKRETYSPLTKLEKRWLKALLQDLRIQLFDPSEEGLEDVEPLFNPEDIVFFDQFLDGDTFEDENYIKNFRVILEAIKKHNSIRVLYQLKNGSEKWTNCNPIRLEYSLRDDKFRLISASKSAVNTFMLSKIKQVEVVGAYEAEDEIDIIIRILSFGSNLQVVGPESFVKQIKNRLETQKSCGH